MAKYLLCASPIYGHVAPMIAIGRGLVKRGDDVTLLTGTKFADRAAAAGLTFAPLPPEVDFDDAALMELDPGRARRTGLARLREGILAVFVRAIPGQWRAVEALLTSGSFDAVLGESAFTGLAPYLLRPRSKRLPVLGVSAIPVMLASVDTAPFGSGLKPGMTVVSRIRNRLLNAVVRRAITRPVDAEAHRLLAQIGAPMPRTSTLDFSYHAFDRLFQLSSAALEYPRRELPNTVEFIGPLRGGSVQPATRPDWWGDVLSARHVVHVSQGTLDNKDFTRLIVPTLRALEGTDAIVVAATGGVPVAELERALGGAIPANARLTTFVSYDDLLPLCDVVVTNGGFGGVQLALSHGVPLVVAGSTEDKPEVAARVDWAGCGVDMRTGTPDQRAIQRAIRTVMDDPAYAHRAWLLGEELQKQPDPIDVIHEALVALR